jgi:heat shock protein HslJ
MRRLLLAVAAVAAAALAGAAAAATPTLTSQTWQLTKLGSADHRTAGITATFTKAGMVSGFSGCNTYNGTYTAKGRSITVGKNIATTQMACAEAAMSTEQAYLSALTAARTYAVSGQTLRLRSRLGRTLLTFTVQPQSLANTSWVVTAYNNGKGAVTSVHADTKIDAHFGKADVSGSAGCNTYSGQVKATPPKISIGPLTSTKKHCSAPEGVMTQESAYLAALGSAATYTLEGAKLELRNANGSIAVTLARA